MSASTKGQRAIASLRTALPALSLMVLGAGAWADDRGVSYNFDPPLAVGLPQTGDWTTVEKWSPTICLLFDSEGHCVQKGYPGLAQPADAAEYVFYKVSISGTAPFSPAIMDMNVATVSAIAEVRVGGNTTLNVNGQLGLNWWQVPIVTPEVQWKRAILENSGQVDVPGMIFSNGKLDITGSGPIHLLGGTIQADDLSNASRIAGTGSITRLGSAGVVEFSNSGVIDANLDGALLTLDALPSGKTLYNSGRLRASDGGRLRIQGGSSTTPSGFIQNAGGTIEALDGSLVQLYSVEIHNGGLATTGAGRIEVTARNVALKGVTNSGLLHVNDGQRLTLTGSITNNGTLSLGSTSASTELYVAAASADDYSLGGTGVLALTHPARSVVRGGSMGGLVNGSDHTIRGAGMVQGLKRVNNWGLLDADLAASTLRIASIAGGSIANTGVMRARNGATLEIAGFDPSNPVPFDNAGGVIQAQDGSLVQISYATLTGGTLTTSGSGVIRLPTSVTSIGGLANLGTLDIRGSTSLLGGTLTNHGDILLGSGSGGASLNVGPDAVLAGGGTLSMSNSSSNSIASAGVGTGTLVNDTGHTIKGAGRIGSFGMKLTNRGLILADQGNPLILADSGTAASVTNEGTLRAAAGSTLQVNQNLVNFSGDTQMLAGGRYEVLGTMRLPVANGIVRNAADIVLDGTASRLYNGNAGTVDALAGFTTNLNAGRFEIRNGRSFALGVFSNAGSMHVGTGSTLTATTYAQTAGLTVVDGSLLVLSDLTIAGGALAGSGIVAGNLINNGALSPGSSPGTMSVNGNYAQPAGSLQIELGQLAHDQLIVSGTATLGGALSLKLWAGADGLLFTPAPGQHFDILLAPAIDGKFDSVSLPDVVGINWSLQYLTDTVGSTDIVRLTAVPVPEPSGLTALAIAGLALARRGGRR